MPPLARARGRRPAALGAQRALAIEQKAYGRDHVQVAITLTNMGIVHEKRGELEAAGRPRDRPKALALRSTCQHGAYLLRHKQPKGAWLRRGAAPAAAGSRLTSASA